MRLRAALGSIALVLLCAAQAFASPSQEYRIKAAFLYNFAQFIEWPATAEDLQRPFVIGIVGEDPFGDVLDSLEKETIHQRPIQVRHYPRPDGTAAQSDLLYISPSESDFLEQLSGRQVLTVGDGQRFVDAGGVIGFVVKDNKVRFVINQKTAQEKGLKINAQLLTLAEKVVS